MSRGHFSRSNEVLHLVADVNRLSVEENLQTYGIDIDRLGVKHSREFIYDPLYDKHFKTVHEWAAFTIEQENDEYDDMNDDFDKHVDGGDY